MDNASTTFYKNGVFQCSVTGLTVDTYYAALDDGSSGTITDAANFGQGGQSGLTYDSASGGYFKYTPPSGFKALSTTNLPAPAIAKPSNYFDAKTYTGNTAGIDTRLLLHADGTNGSTSFINSSESAHSFTVTGSAQISTAQSEFGGASARERASIARLGRS